MARGPAPRTLLLVLIVCLLGLNLLLITWGSPHGTGRRTASIRREASVDDAFADALVGDRQKLAQALHAAEKQLNATLDSLRISESLLGALREDKRKCELRYASLSDNTHSSAPVATLPKVGLLSESPVWLTVGIPSVPRRGESPLEVKTTMLYRTVVSYLEQLAAMDAVTAAVRVVVMNNRPHEHSVFDAVEDHFRRTLTHDTYYGRAASRFEFHSQPPPDAPSDYRDEEQPIADEFAGASHEMPSPQVRRQSLDVVRMLDHVIATPSQYFLFTEDDFVLCPNGLLALNYMISKARRYYGHPFSALRCGFGLNGIVLHNSDSLGDVARFRQYLLRHYQRRPPDHLVVEFFGKESSEAAKHFGPHRRPAAFRHNVFLHIGGKKSTLRDEVAWSMPACFTELIVPQLFEVEAWNARECEKDDMWPCDSPAAERPVVLRWNISRASEVSKHWVASSPDG